MSWGHPIAVPAEEAAGHVSGTMGRPHVEVEGWAEDGDGVRV